eukprot:Rmarinus@m.13852
MDAEAAPDIITSDFYEYLATEGISLLNTLVAQPDAIAELHPGKSVLSLPLGSDEVDMTCPSSVFSRVVAEALHKDRVDSSVGKMSPATVEKAKTNRPARTPDNQKARKKKKGTRPPKKNASRSSPGMPPERPMPAPQAVDIPEEDAEKAVASPGNASADLSAAVSAELCKNLDTVAEAVAPYVNSEISKQEALVSGLISKTREILDEQEESLLFVSDVSQSEAQNKAAHAAELLPGGMPITVDPDPTDATRDSTLPSVDSVPMQAGPGDEGTANQLLSLYCEPQSRRRQVLHRPTGGGSGSRSDSGSRRNSFNLSVSQTKLVSLYAQKNSYVADLEVKRETERIFSRLFSRGVLLPGIEVAVKVYEEYIRSGDENENLSQDKLRLYRRQLSAFSTLQHVLKKESENVSRVIKAIQNVLVCGSPPDCVVEALSTQNALSGGSSDLEQRIADMKICPELACNFM